MRLLADRFICDDRGTAIDLATGAAALLRISAAGSAHEQMHWNVRCDRWRRLQHRVFAPLLDFGILDVSSRFEAWQCGERSRDAGTAARSVSDAAAEFLRAARLTVGSDVESAVHEGRTGPIVVPGVGTGYPDGSVVHIAGGLPLEKRGLHLVPRPAVAALAEMIEHADTCRSRMAVLWGPPGSGKTIVALELARIARANGFIPLASRLLESPYAEVWEGRSLFIIARDVVPSAWSVALQSMLRSPRPHVVLVVSEADYRAVDGVQLTRLDTDALVRAVYPAVDARDQLRRVRRAAVRSHGLPGRFVRLLWRSDRRERLPVAANARGLRVAESTATYGSESAPEQSPAAGRSAWPAPEELDQLRRRRDGALGLLARGRHGPGMRQLRLAIGGLARRDDWANAGTGALALAASLLGRGRPRDAQVVLDEARKYVVHAGKDAQLVDVAILNGEAWIDLARLDEAEAVLAAARTTARGLADRAKLADAAVALARCLYWRGQYAEAAAALGDVQDPASSWTMTRRLLLAARIAVGQGAFDRATVLATDGVRVAREAADPRAGAAASSCMALVHLAVGDLDTADRDLADTLSAARRAHDPLRAIRARLLQVEIERRRGRGGAAARFERLVRATATLPPLLRVRADLLEAALSDRDSRQVAERVSRQVAATGLGALAVYVGGHRGTGDAFESLAAEVVAIVHACQAADDEAVVLRDVCARVRRQIHAAAVAFVAGSQQRFATLASDGPRIDGASAERAVTAGITIAPHRLEDRLEASVPVRYGGAPIGALSARWTLGSSHDMGRAAATLEMAAAAAAPIVAGQLSRRQTTEHVGTELFGVTAAIRELRSQVQRAGSAPFPVLIEGESGSGKELVARAIHRSSPRRDRAFCALNCAALPDDLIEAELFGHTRGAFTSAIAERQGVFEEAHGGTLFLDEIGELSPRAQAKVLRVIQEGELRRVGENVPRRVDVRIVAATNRDLRMEIQAGRFRADLWYRLDVVRIRVPPLRDRREDIVVLAEHFWREAAERVNSRATLASETLAALARYDWPGNVRELQNVLAALAVRTPRRGVVPPTALPPQFAGSGRDESWRFTDARRAFEERFVRAALVRSGGHRGRAAAELGVSRQGLSKLMTRLGIMASDEADADELGEG